MVQGNTTQDSVRLLEEYGLFSSSTALFDYANSSHQLVPLQNARKKCNFGVRRPGKLALSPRLCCVHLAYVTFKCLYHWVCFGWSSSVLMLWEECV